jgi:Ca2+-binding EF-hand superfamily protein
MRKTNRKTMRRQSRMRKTNRKTMRRKNKYRKSQRGGELNSEEKKQIRIGVDINLLYTTYDFLKDNGVDHESTDPFFMGKFSEIRTEIEQIVQNLIQAKKEERKNFMKGNFARCMSKKNIPFLTVNDAKRLFDLIDKDGDRSINEDELLALYPGGTKDGMGVKIGKFDKDNDEQISLDEFIRVLKTDGKIDAGDDTIIFKEEAIEKQITTEFSEEQIQVLRTEDGKDEGGEDGGPESQSPRLLTQASPSGQKAADTAAGQNLTQLVNEKTDEFTKELKDVKQKINEIINVLKPIICKNKFNELEVGEEPNVAIVKIVERLNSMGCKTEDILKLPTPLDVSDE